MRKSGTPKASSPGSTAHGEKAIFAAAPAKFSLRAVRPPDAAAARQLLTVLLQHRGSCSSSSRRKQASRGRADDGHASGTGGSGSEYNPDHEETASHSPQRRPSAAAKKGASADVHHCGGRLLFRARGRADLWHPRRTQPLRTPQFGAARPTQAQAPATIQRAFAATGAAAATIATAAEYTLGETPSFAGAAQRTPLTGATFTIPRSGSAPTSVFSFTRTRARTRSEEGEGEDTAGFSTSCRSPSLTFEYRAPSPSVAAAGVSATPTLVPRASPAIAFAQPDSNIPYLDLGAVAGTDSGSVPSTASARVSAAEMWVCTSCSQPKDLGGAHLRGKTDVRSDCWPCGRKRTFVRSRPAAWHPPLQRERTPSVVGTAAERSPTPTVSAGFPPPPAPQQQQPHPALTQPASGIQMQHGARGVAPAFGLAPQAAAPGDWHWVCEGCGNEKALWGSHLEGKTSVRSDCWPCGKKRTFAKLDLASFLRHESCGFPPASRGPVTRVASLAGGEHEPAPAAIHRVSPTALLQMQSPDADACGFAGAWSAGEFLGSVLRLRSVLLRLRARAIAADTPRAAPLCRLLAPSRQRQISGVRVFCGGDGAAYALRDDLQYGADEFGGRAVTTEHLAFVAQLGIEAEALAASQGRSLGAVYCNNSVTFAALSALFSFTGNSDVAVYGPARDPTICSGVLDDISTACGGAQVSVSVSQKIAAVQQVHELTQLVVTPNGATAQAIRAAACAGPMGARPQAQAGSCTTSIDLVVLGRVAPWAPE